MRHEVPATQLTLVCHYGEKPAEFAALIRALQQTLSAAMGCNFQPYALEQIHGTIIGLEGTPVAGGVRSENFLRLRGEERTFDFGAMIHFLREQLEGFTIQVGGFQAARDYAFLSQGQHPFIRSFSIQRETAVAMGWPVEGARFPSSLDQLRRALESFGALRKWAWREGEVDNDFYFVLGRVSTALPETQRTEIERAVREQLASSTPLALNISLETLQFVGYTDLRLPRETSRVFPLNDAATTAHALTDAYGFCNR